MGYMNECEYSINEAKREIKNSVKVYLRKNADGSYVLPADRKNPFYVVGSPGIGKTEMAKQISKELGIGFYSTSLTHHTRNSLLGLPVISSVGSYKSTEYTMPDILAQIERKCEDGEREGILLIDEFASMSESLVAPMLAFLQNKSIGDHRLPEGWIMILCSNPPEYNETAREFDAAVMDRVRVINIAFSLEDFLQYAKVTGIHETIIDFIQQKPGRAYRCGKKRLDPGADTDGSQEYEDEIVTARSWENLSQCIYGYEDMGEDISVRLVYQFIKSRALAEEFYRYYSISKAAIGSQDLDNIMEGRNIDSYRAKVNVLGFDKKWQIVKLLREKMSQENKVTSMEGRLTEYLNELHNRWLSTELIPYSEECYETLQNMISATPDEADKEIYGALDKDLRPLCRNVVSDILYEIDVSYDIDRRGNKAVLDDLSKKLQQMNQKNDQNLSRNVKHISNVIEFVSGLENGALKENLIREINKDKGMLYTLVKRDCPEYTAVLGEVLGESA